MRTKRAFHAAAPKTAVRPFTGVGKNSYGAFLSREKNALSLREDLSLLNKTTPSLDARW